METNPFSQKMKSFSVFGVLAFCAATETFAQSLERAMWVWDDNPGLVQFLDNNKNAQTNLVNFVKAPLGHPEHAITRVLLESRSYVYPTINETYLPKYAIMPNIALDPLLDNQASAGKLSPNQKLKNLIRNLKSNHVAVEYLGGTALWLATDEFAAVPVQTCKDVVAYNRSTSDPLEQFDGVHLDIEPHTITQGPYAGQYWQNQLPGERYNKDWIARWKAILTGCRAALNEFNPNMTLSIDVGADFSVYNTQMLTFINQSSSVLNYVGIMNYFDNRLNSQGKISFVYGAKDENGKMVGGLDQNLNAYKIPMLFGLETGPTSIAPNEASFYQEGNTVMEQVIDYVFAPPYVDNPLNKGIAIHHYGSYRNLKENCTNNCVVAPAPTVNETGQTPVPAEPTPTEPTPSEPVPSEPAPSEPAPSEPAPSEPAPSEPAPSEPAPSEPAPSEPVPSEPAPSEPAPSEPAPSEPAPTQPAPTQPAPTQPPKASKPQCSISKATKVLQATGLPSNVKCAMRTDTYDGVLVSNGTATFQNAVGARALELYEQAKNLKEKDCRKFVMEVSCPLK